VSVTPTQFGALVSLAYNIGGAALSKSTLIKRLNAGRTQEAADQFLVWNRAGGRVLSGLQRRREAERALFLHP
jgi:lysozyme